MRPLHQTIAAAILLLGSLVHASAQDRSVAFRRISLEHGLSQSSVTSITQDRHGFLWFATQGGLDRYDGYSFASFNHRPNDSLSLAHNLISTLHTDRFGVLWVGTQNGVVHRFDERTETFRRYVLGPETQQVRASRQINAITVDDDGNVWAAYQAGIAVLEKGSAAFRVVMGTLPGRAEEKDEKYRTVWSDPLGNVWTGEHGKIRRQDRVTKSWTDVRVVTGRHRPSSVSYEDFIQDAEGTIWAGSTEGLFAYVAGKDAFVIDTRDGTPFAPQDVPGTILSVTADRQGYLWIGKFTGTYRYHPKRKTLEHFVPDPSDGFSISEITGLSMFTERNGIVLIGTHSGVNAFAPWQIKFRVVQHVFNDERSVSWNNIRGFCEDGEGNIWVATLRGLNRSRGSIMEFDRYSNSDYVGPSSGDDIVWAVITDSANGAERVWVGTNSNGVSVFERRRIGNTVREKNFGVLRRGCIQSFVRDGAGGMWMGVLGDGLVHFDADLRVDQHYRHDPDDPHGISNNGVLGLVTDERGRLWIGTDNGLNMMEAPGRFRVFRHDPKDPNSPAGNNILSMLPDGKGNLWFGTYAGLNRLHVANGTFTRFGEADGLPNNVIYGIAQDDDGDLWLSTNKGIARFSPETRSVTSYTPTQGLQSNEYNQRAVLRSRSGHMYFGGVNGFNVFHPDSLAVNPNVPKVVLTELRIMNKLVHPVGDETRLRTSPQDADTLYLSYKDAVITFQYAALDFTSPGANRYAYKMDGFDESWVQVGAKREVTYTNLDPGEYTFRVAAANSDGLWNNDALSLTVFIDPPFWKTWWFRGIVALMFVSIGPIEYVRRVKKLKKEVAIQQEFSRRLIDSQERERTRIARELHDGLGQDLLVVKNRAVMGLKTAEKGSKPAVQLREIDQTVTDAIKQVREIARNLRPYQLDSLGLTDAIKSTLTRVADSSGIKIHADIQDIAGLFPKDVEVSLFRIIQETTNNLVKHAKATEANYAIYRSNGSVIIEISDNGRGFDALAIAKSDRVGLGLSGIAERVRMIGGEYVLQTSPGKGTRHTITMHEGRT